MYKWSANRVFNKTALSSHRDSVMQNKRHSAHRLGFLGGALLFVPLLLIGCTNSTTSRGASQTAQLVIPEDKIIDYRIAQCDILWRLDDKETLENSLFWLRAMDCAERQSSTEARAIADTLSVVSWSTAFKQGILIGNADPTPTERRRIVEQLNSYGQSIPVTIRPLIHLWREQQVLRTSLAEARIRYQRLQNESDNQIDNLRENQARLQYNLQETKRKLENLTDIERQLSSRKQLQNQLPENATQVAPALSEKTGQIEADTSIPQEPQSHDTP